MEKLVSFPKKFLRCFASVNNTLRSQLQNGWDIGDFGFSRDDSRFIETNTHKRLLFRELKKKTFKSKVIGCVDQRECVCLRLTTHLLYLKRTSIFCTKDVCKCV